MALLFDQAEISIGITLQHSNYAFFAIVCLWVYDFVLTLDEEFEFIPNARWQTPKLLCLICRYLPFVLVFIDIFRIVHPGLSVKSCTTCFALNSYIGGTILCCAESLFILRVWAMTGCKRWRGITMCCNAALFMIPVVVTLTLFDSSSIVLQSPIPKVASCYSSRENRVIFVAYILLVVGELEILGFMLYRSWKLYRELGDDLPLLRVLVTHQVFYFACGLFFSTTVMIIMVTLPASYGNMASDLQIVVHAILVTRMHRELWNTAHCPQDSSAGIVSLPLVFVAGSSSEMHN